MKTRTRRAGANTSLWSRQRKTFHNSPCHHSKRWNRRTTQTVIDILSRSKRKGSTICSMGIGSEPELYSRYFIRCSGVNCFKISTSVPRVSNTRALLLKRWEDSSRICLSLNAIRKNPSSYKHTKTEQIKIQRIVATIKRLYTSAARKESTSTCSSAWYEAMCWPMNRVRNRLEITFPAFIKYAIPWG